MRRGHVRDLYPVAVEIHRIASSGIGLGGPRRWWNRALSTDWRTHPRQDVLMCEDAGGAAIGIDIFAHAGAPDVTEDRPAGSGHFLISAGTVGVGAGVDDVTDRSIRQPLHGRQYLVGHLPRTGVHEDGAGGADLNGDVRACAGNHVEILPELHHIEIAAARLLRSSGHRPASHTSKAGEQERRGYPVTRDAVHCCVKSSLRSFISTRPSSLLRRPASPQPELRRGCWSSRNSLRDTRARRAGPRSWSRALLRTRVLSRLTDRRP